MFNFEPIRPAHFQDIINLEAFLWGKDDNYRYQMFYWKYVNNPFPIKLLGAVAVFNGSVIGFRGLVPNYWQYRNTSINTVYYTDAVVHPNYRGRNILAQLNLFLFEIFKNQYDFVIALSSNNASSHIYSAQKAIVFSHCTYYKNFYLLKRRHIIYEVIKDLILMWEIVENYSLLNQNILDFKLCKSYFFWKLSEPERNYALLTNKEEGHNCYALIEIREKNIEVYDFNFKNSIIDVLGIIQNYIIDNKIFYVNFPIYDNQQNIIPFLKKNGFRMFTSLKYLNKNFNNSKDILIKPFKSMFNDNDFYVDGLNLKMAESWNLKHFNYV